MKVLRILFLFILSQTLLNPNSYAEQFLVGSKLEFDQALENAGIEDTIAWKSGLYEDVFMDIDKSNLVIMAEVSGDTKFTGASKVFISGSYITLSGFQFIDGDIGTDDVIKTTGSYIHFTQLNIKGYISYKYLVVQSQCRFVTISYCNFENRLNLDDKNILSILVDDTEPGYHKIQYCSFKNFEGTGNDLGIEPIRIGLSTQGEFASRTIVEYCYFTQCNGDGEIISNKAGQNIFRYNTFQDNPKAELVLRHGSEAVVYGNFFLEGMGGVRVREGQKHVIFNNYFYDLSSRSIYLQNEESDPLDTIDILFNTIIESAEFRLGGSGNDKPGHVTIANNIFTQPNDNLFEDPTGTETWIGNITFGALGISKPVGVTEIDPDLVLNANNFFEPGLNSPAIDAAMFGYPEPSNYPGLDVDSIILYDLMKQMRPLDVSLKDVGCSEYPPDLAVLPWVNEDNTGPEYLHGEQSLNLKIKIQGKGSVILDPPSGIYVPDTEVTLTAVPEQDYVFSEWSGDLTGEVNPMVITMTEDKEITANFSTITGLSSGNLQSFIRLFPNPVRHKMTLSVQEDASSILDMELYTIYGHKVRSLIHPEGQLSNFSITEEVSDLAPGIYLIFLTFEASRQQKTRILEFIKL